MGNYWSDWEGTSSHPSADDEDDDVVVKSTWFDSKDETQDAQQQERLEEQTESLPVPIRTALVESVVQSLFEVDGSHENHHDVEELLGQVEQEIQESQSKIDTWITQEAYLATRIAKFQQILLQQEDQDTTENKQALGKVMDIRFTLLLNMKSYQRKVDSLKEKQKRLQIMTQECKDFVVLAAIDDRHSTMMKEERISQHDHDDDEQQQLVVLPQHVDTIQTEASCSETLTSAEKENDLEMGDTNGIAATVVVTPPPPPVENQ